ncbi:MAG TPA: hypothetical protein VK524_01455, partial [Polyangiaceae bacterium]|nr:hypothetical protein [Polyangiaceae bacterium]
EEREACENPFAFASIAAKGPIEPASVRAANCGVLLSPDFDVWFKRATAYRTDERFASAVAAITDLAHALTLAVPSPPPPLSVAMSSPRTGEGRARDSRTENLGPVPLHDTSGVISAALSFTDSQLIVEEELTAPSGESTEMPLSVTNGGLASASRRRWPLVAAAGFLTVAVVCAGAWHVTTAPPPPLAKSFAQSGAAARSIQIEAVTTPDSDPPLTPADLALAPGEPAAPGRRQRSAPRPARQRAALKAPARHTTNAPAAAEPEPPRPAPPPRPEDRATLYRRD